MTDHPIYYNWDQYMRWLQNLLLEQYLCLPIASHLSIPLPMPPLCLPPLNTSAYASPLPPTSSCRCLCLSIPLPVPSLRLPRLLRLCLPIASHLFLPLSMPPLCLPPLPTASYASPPPPTSSYLCLCLPTSFHLSLSLSCRGKRAIFYTIAY